MTQVFSVAGGKGGVGKSVVSILLARAFSMDGKRTVIVDADLGAANLHTLLAIRNPPLGLVDFLSGRSATLDGVLQKTADRNIELISGAGEVLGVANLKWMVKRKLIRHLRELGFERVIVDLGAGSSFNVLDLFLYTGDHVLVLGTEPTALQNMAEFLKFSVARLLVSRFGKEESVAGLIDRFVNPANGQGIGTVGELLGKAAKRNKSVTMEMLEIIESFQPWVVVNMVDSPAEGRKYFNIAANYAKEFLRVELKLLAMFPRDGDLRDAIKKNKSLLSFDVSPYAKEFGKLHIFLAD